MIPRMKAGYYKTKKYSTLIRTLKLSDLTLNKQHSRACYQVQYGTKKREKKALDVI